MLAKKTINWTRFHNQGSFYRHSNRAAFHLCTQLVFEDAGFHFFFFEKLYNGGGLGIVFALAGAALLLVSAAGLYKTKTA